MMFAGLGLLYLGGPFTAAAQAPPAARAKAAAPSKIAAPETSPAALPRLLAEGAAALEQELNALKNRAETAAQAQSLAEKSLKELEGRVAALKASLAIKKISLPEAEEALKSYNLQGEKLAGKLKELSPEIEALSKDREAKAASQATLQAEVARLKTSGHPLARSRELQTPYQKYQRLATAQQQEATQLLQSLEKRAEFQENERQLVSVIQGELQKYVDETWKAELLKRQEHVSLIEQVTRLVQTLAALPEKGHQWLGELVSSGRLVAFAKKHLAQLIGLLALLLLVVWGARRLQGLLTPHLAAWQASGENLGFRFLLGLGLIFTAQLLPLGLLMWVWLGLATLGLLAAPPALLVFYLLAALMALRLSGRVMTVAFAGQEGGGLLPLDESTARFYRRSGKLFLTYVWVGLLILGAADLLEFPRASRQFLGYLFVLGLMGWALWLLRRPYLARLIPELAGPAFLRRLGVMRALRGVVLLLLGMILLSDLLGFHNLSLYLSRAAALTAAVIISLGVLWLVVGRILGYLLHPELGWATRRFPDQGAVLQKVYNSVRGVILLILGVAVVLGSLKAWGIRPERLAWAFQWLNWGPSLGPIRLTLLHVGTGALVFYAGFWLSRLTRNLMQLRVYPKTGWDKGIQYTISTSLHYTILILTFLVSLNILGLPLTNLALVAGALGVGIGFGLQNLVNNFISGLILLFERPIKVGDILEIDGQWGKVKEIRVRSTIFQTVDRAVLIIPNSELLSKKIINWTHYGWGPVRLTLEVSVAYGSEVDRVTRILSEVCRSHPRVLDDPPPSVLFKAFGDNALIFDVRIYIRSPDPKERTLATHEVNSAIFEAFKKHGVEVPYPQRDLFIKNWPPGLGGEEG
jgi:small-conductance mechanosensitive channel